MWNTGCIEQASGRSNFESCLEGGGGGVNRQNLKLIHFKSN
jgi:hypothetical protein